MSTFASCPAYHSLFSIHIVLSKQETNITLESWIILYSLIHVVLSKQETNITLESWIILYSLIHVVLSKQETNISVHLAGSNIDPTMFTRGW
jgi:hypothetical protein